MNREWFTYENHGSKKSVAAFISLMFKCFECSYGQVVYKEKSKSLLFISTLARLSGVLKLICYQIFAANTE